MNQKTAVLVDGAFFIRRYRRLYPEGESSSAKQMVRALKENVLLHLRNEGRVKAQLFRILFYDCPPGTKQIHHPVTRKFLDFSKSREAVFRASFHDYLRKERKVALRLGRLQEAHLHWAINPEKTKPLLKGEIQIRDLEARDVTLGFRQKGVDVRLGIDIATLALKKLVDQIILVAADSDFVPAAKLARREGVDVILDPMWAREKSSDLLEHVDGIYSPWKHP